MKPEQEQRLQELVNIAVESAKEHANCCPADYLFGADLHEYYALIRCKTTEYLNSQPPTNPNSGT